ncbi:hypothetical protein HC823_00265 [Candidatus Gracilibacteria bacterium]|nr:hypothetical protein [Candidatus Gracilibacteria bacterium]
MKHHHWIISVLCLTFLWAGFSGNKPFFQNIEKKALKVQVFTNELMGEDGGEKKLELLETNTQDLQEEYKKLIEKLATLKLDQKEIEKNLENIEETAGEKTEESKTWLQSMVTKIKNIFSKENQEKIANQTSAELQAQKEKIEGKKAEVEEKIREIQERYDQAKTAAIKLREGVLKFQEAARETNSSIKELGGAFELSKEKE